MLCLVRFPSTFCLVEIEIYCCSVYIVVFHVFCAFVWISYQSTSINSVCVVCSFCCSVHMYTDSFNRINLFASLSLSFSLNMFRSLLFSIYVATSYYNLRKMSIYPLQCFKIYIVYPFRMNAVCCVCIDKFLLYYVLIAIDRIQ